MMNWEVYRKFKNAMIRSLGSMCGDSFRKKRSASNSLCYMVVSLDDSALLFLLFFFLNLYCPIHYLQSSSSITFSGKPSLTTPNRIMFSYFYIITTPITFGSLSINNMRYCKLLKVSFTGPWLLEGRDHVPFIPVFSGLGPVHISAQVLNKCRMKQNEIASVSEKEAIY